MIGTKFYKPVQDWEEYARVAEWCNANNAVIVEYDDRYEVEAVPGPSFDELKECKLNELSASFNERVGGSVDCAVDGQHFQMQFDRSDSLAVQGMAELLEATGQPVGYLTQADDTTVYDVPLATIKSVLVEMLKAYAACHQRKQSYRSEINACTTKEELDAIEFSWL